MNKRGVNHIEVMLSFLIFIGFVVFAFYFFSPLQTSRLVESSLSYTIDEIKDNTIIRLETYSISLDLSSPASANTMAISLDSSLPNVRVENYLGIAVPSKKIGNIIYFNWTDTAYGAGTGFIMIKLSEDIDPHQNPPSESPAVDESSYTIGSSNTLKLVSEKKFLALKNSYDSGYESLKNNFNLPDRVEFGFSLVFESGEKIEAQKNIPGNVEIFSNSERLEVLRSDGKIEFAELSVQIW